MIEPTFDSKHVADAIVHIASLPNSVNVLEMNIMCVLSNLDILKKERIDGFVYFFPSNRAAGMPYVGRG